MKSKVQRKKHTKRLHKNKNCS